MGLVHQEEYSIGPYSLDIYLPELQRAVEVDGPSHKFRRRQDAERDAYLLEQGISTVRIRAGTKKDEALERILN